MLLEAKKSNKGITISVNSILIVALALIICLAIASFFGKSVSELDATQVSNAFNQGCSIFSSAYGCDTEKLSEVKTSLVVEGQKKTLLEVCRIISNKPEMSAFKCRSACSICPKRIYDGSPCEDDEDCVSPLTSAEDWSCEEIKDGNPPRQCKLKGVDILNK